MKEKSYVMIKPEFANYPEVIAEIKRRFLEAGLKIAEESYVTYDKKSAEEHYEEHREREFFGELVDYLASDKSYAMIIEGEDAINTIRSLVLRDKKAGLQPGDIRFDIPMMFGLPIDMTKNVIHASDKPASAEKEIKIYRKVAAKENQPQRQ